MALKQVYDDLDFASNRIGEQTRNISLGVLAIVWLFLAGGKNAPVVEIPPSAPILFSAGGLAMLSLVLDYFQYLSAYLLSRTVLKQAEATENPDEAADYDYESAGFKIRTLFFVAKQGTCLLSVVVMVYGIVRGLLGV